MILYSDGILECTNKDGKPLGQEGFDGLVRESFHHDSHSFLANMFTAYDSRANSQQDDITFVLIRYTDAEIE